MGGRYYLSKFQLPSSALFDVAVGSAHSRQRERFAFQTLVRGVLLRLLQARVCVSARCKQRSNVHTLGSAVPQAVALYAVH